MADRVDTPFGDKRLYVVGDIHGRSDLLDRIVDEIRRDLEKYGAQPALTITLGDYVDRGPDSKGVLDRLSINPFPTPYIALKGNHEVLFELFVKSPKPAINGDAMAGLRQSIHTEFLLEI